MLPASPAIQVTNAPVAQLFSGEFLWFAVGFFVLAILAAAVGARDIAGVSMEIARIFVIIFLVLAIVALLL